MRKVLSISSMNLLRLFRDRTALFFVFVFPFLIILALGATFGSASTPKLGVVSTGGALADDLVARLEATEDVTVVRYDDVDTLRDAVERGRVEGGLAVPSSYDTTIGAGGTASLTYLARPTGSGQELRLTVASAVDRQDVTVTAARVAMEEGAAASFREAFAAARSAAEVAPQTQVAARTAGGAADYSLATGASQELVLFVFVTSLSASSMLIESRRLGCSRRMLASPTPVRTILAGEALGRFAIALLQALLIVAGTVVLFGVRWGNVATAGLTIALLAATATGAAMLLGAGLHNEQQAGALGVFIGLGLAALGGAMVPLEIFPPTMATVAHLTPHAWAIEALAGAMANESPAGVATELLALGVYATALLTAAILLFRRSLTGRAA